MQAKIQHGQATVYFQSSEKMTQVKDGSVKLLVTGPPYLGEKAEMGEYRVIYWNLVKEANRVLREDGYLVVIITDPYRGGGVHPRNANFAQVVLSGNTFKLLDMKVWKKKEGDLFQLPFSLVWVFGKPDARRPKPKPNPDYFKGVWEFHSTNPGHLNAWPDPLCQRIVRACSEEGDLVVDPFAGTCRLLHICNSMNRRSIGYEIDREGLERAILANLHATPTAELSQEDGLLGGISNKKK